MVRGCPLRKKGLFGMFFVVVFFGKFVAVLLTTKPGGGVAKGLSGLSTKKKKLRLPFICFLGWGVISVTEHF